MASVDQGASQRRGNESTLTPINQGSSLSPVGSYGQSYFTNFVGLLGSHDSLSVAMRQREAVLTQIGSPTTQVESPNKGSGYASSFLLLDSHDLTTHAARQREALFSAIGLGITVPSASRGAGYFSDAVGLLDSHDARTVVGRQKSSPGTPLGNVAGIETPNHGTNYATTAVGTLSPFAILSVTYYKLQAWDVTCSPVPRSVQWVSTSVSFADAPPSPCGGTLTNLTILDRWGSFGT